MVELFPLGQARNPGQRLGPSQPHANAMGGLWERNGLRMLWLNPPYPPFTFSNPLTWKRRRPWGPLVWLNTDSGIILPLA